MHYSSRWIIKYDSNDKIREVKLVYNPEEYRQGKRAENYIHNKV